MEAEPPRRNALLAREERRGVGSSMCCVWDHRTQREQILLALPLLLYIHLILCKGVKNKIPLVSLDFSRFVGYSERC